MVSWLSKLASIVDRNKRQIARARKAVKARLTRRQLMRGGLVAAGGALAVKQGIGAKALADATLSIADGGGPSPMTVEFMTAMPELQKAVKQPAFDITDPNNPLGTQLSPVPNGFTWTHGATVRTPQQLFSFDSKTGTFGAGPSGDYPPQRFYELVVQEKRVNFSPQTPGWGLSTIWGFDGQFPGPLIRETYGVPVLVRYTNRLSALSVRQDFGITNISTHLHNAHTPTESDGHPLDFFPSEATQAEAGVLNLKRDDSKFNQGFKDQHYPNQYAGFATIKNATGADGDPNEALGSMWYHDHTVDFTAANVYHGLAGFYNLFDDLDTGNEATGLHLPSGDNDVPIIFLDARFGPTERNADGTLSTQPVFDNFNTDGLLGDKFTANGIIQPFFKVQQRRYRLRLYNAGPSRFYEFWITDGKKFIGKPFWQIASDGNLLPQALNVDSVRLSVAERADVVVDFAKLKSSGSKLYLVNRLEQVSGRGPTGNLLPFAQSTQIILLDIGGPPDELDNSVDFSSGANAKDPGRPLALRPLPTIPPLAGLTKRSFRFERGNGAWQVNGKLYEFDVNFNTVGPTNVPAASGAAGEVWTIQNGGGGWAHPIHPHFEELRIIKINGQAPPASLAGRKDVIPLGPGDEVQMFIRLRDLTGRYVMHCHNVVHEDHAMMVEYDINGAGA
jgi:FtsP/CotA-like multicopper oxidase with cupredoxin domain